jgi:hypothetical protein
MQIEVVVPQQSERITFAGRSRDKIARYGWLSRNERGKLEYVAKSLLQVDATYQRSLNDAKRLRIASQFNWAAFGVLLVARRADGSLWVIDGQHRLMAAQSRSDVQEVPVAIFEFGDNVMDEAKDFLITNKNRRPLSGVDSFKALVVSGDPIALKVQDLIRAAGRVVGETSAIGKRIRCVKAMYNCMSTNSGAMERVWPLIIELSSDQEVDNRLVQGMHWLEGHLVDVTGGKRSLTESELRRKLSIAGYSAILRSIGDAAAYYHRGGQLVFARGILKVINHKRRSKLRMRGDSEVTPS